MTERGAPDDDAAWLRPPRFHADDGEHRQASWLELFFDLVFVVTVAGMVSLLRDDLATFGVLFVPTWWLWMDFSYYGDQFDADDVVYRLALLTVMFGVLFTGKARESALHDDVSAAPLVFGAMYAILVGLYARAYRPNPELRPLIRRYVVAMTVAGALFVISALVPPPWRFALWFTAIAVPMANSPLTYAKLPNLPSQVSHMPERFGLFTIIVLGESIVAVGAALQRLQFSAPVIGACLAGFAIASALWWIYFVRDDPSALSAFLEGDRRALLKSHAYGYAHALVYAGIVVGAVGVEEAILGLGEPVGGAGHGGGEGSDEESGHGGGHGPFVAALLAGGTAVALLGTAIVHRAASRPLPGIAFAARLIFAAGLAALAVAGASGVVSGAATLHATAAAAVALAALETRLLPHPEALPSEAGEV